MAKLHVAGTIVEMPDAQAQKVWDALERLSPDGVETVSARPDDISKPEIWVRIPFGSAVVIEFDS